mmetsp:Transcript_7511/g.16804  ORF Transcript_7511/g.16804 Transcript_7511/m.16804 type:complete len:253 (+) Transcript_7511:398-1156(+)
MRFICEKERALVSSCTPPFGARAPPSSSSESLADPPSLMRSLMPWLMQLAPEAETSSTHSPKYDEASTEASSSSELRRSERAGALSVIIIRAAMRAPRGGSQARTSSECRGASAIAQALNAFIDAAAGGEARMSVSRASESEEALQTAPATLLFSFFVFMCRVVCPRDSIAFHATERSSSLSYPSGSPAAMVLRAARICLTSSTTSSASCCRSISSIAPPMITSASAAAERNDTACPLVFCAAATKKSFAYW